MTLITYSARVHIADGVLEDALISELELNKYAQPLLLCLGEHQQGEFSERVRSGIPYHCTPLSYAIDQSQSIEQIITDIIDVVELSGIDVIVAYRSALAISIAGECCQKLIKRSDKRMLAFKNTVGTHFVPPDLFAIPGIDGLPDLSRSRRNANSYGALYSDAGTHAQPSVAIYDPTLTLGESLLQTASATVNTLVQCVEAYLSENYNPPADGIAYDGMVRIVKYLPSIHENDNLDSRREQMAASFEGTLALQKGGGIVQDITDALAAVSGLDLNESALKILLLPLAFEIGDSIGKSERSQTIRRALNIPAQVSFNDGLSKLLADLPLPCSLQAHGLTGDHISQAASVVVDAGLESILSASSLETMIKALPPLAESVAS